jgi:hypothetical protein
LQLFRVFLLEVAMRSYQAARSLFSFISAFSWILIIGGILLIFRVGDMALEMSRYNRVPEMIGLILGVIPGIVTTIVGFFGLVTSQMGRAGVDSAEYGQQMLQIARDQLEISRQTLHKGDALRQSFEALASAKEASSSASYAEHLTQPKAAADTSPVLPTTASQPTVIGYKGKEIAALENGFHFAGTAFPTLAAAQAHIDLLLPNDGLLAPAERQSAQP